MSELKSLKFFIEKFDCEKDRYWAISDYLLEILDNEFIPDKTTIDELITFIETYTVKFVKEHNQIDEKLNQREVSDSLPPF